VNAAVHVPHQKDAGGDVEVEREARRQKLVDRQLPFACQSCVAEGEPVGVVLVELRVSLRHEGGLEIAAHAQVIEDAAVGRGLRRSR
jgi:hypothetical protein